MYSFVDWLNVFDGFESSFIIVSIEVIAFSS
jgi:hypothetical protein